MTDYTAVTSGEKDADSPINVTLVGKLDDNPHAMFEGASGAPRLQEAAIDSGVVSQAKLQTALQQTSSSVGAGVKSEISYTGGTYNLMAGMGLGTDINNGDVRGHNDNTYANKIGFVNDSAGTRSYYFQSRYITACPPYDLGDGEILLFLDVLIDNTGHVVGVNSSLDPVWANNGPTDIRPDSKRDGKEYKTITITPNNFKSLNPQERAQALRECECEEIEITTDFKNSDMNIISHHLNTSDTSVTKCLLDPVSSVIEDLATLRDAGEDINKIIMDGYIKIGNTQLKRSGPNGILIPSVNWKNTRG